MEQRDGYELTCMSPAKMTLAPCFHSLTRGPWSRTRHASTTWCRKMVTSPQLFLMCPHLVTRGREVLSAHGEDHRSAPRLQVRMITEHKLK